MPIIILSGIMGVMFGSIFGIMDLEDLSLSYVKAQLIREENFCVPIGVIFGAICGYFSCYKPNKVKI